MLTLIAFLNQPLLSFIAVTWQGIPWWVGLVLLPPLFFYAFVRASYEEYREVEGELDALRARVEELQKRTISPQPYELGGDCLHLSEELFAWIAKRQILDPSHDIHREAMNAETEAERNRLRKEEWKEMRHYEAETVELYQEWYRKIAVALYETLERRGSCGPRYRHFFEQPSNDVEIQKAAEHLEDIGNKLRENKL